MPSNATTTAGLSSTKLQKLADCTSQAFAWGQSQGMDAHLAADPSTLPGSTSILLIEAMLNKRMFTLQQSPQLCQVSPANPATGPHGPTCPAQLSCSTPQPTGLLPHLPQHFELEALSCESTPHPMWAWHVLRPGAGLLGCVPGNMATIIVTQHLTVN